MILVYILAGIYGLCVGSFLNVVIYRLPNNMNLAKPASHCTSCGYELRWYDNIPVISYIMLGGKCRKCKSHISIRYTLVEILNCVLWVLCALLFWGSTPSSWIISIAAMLFCSLMVCIGFIDLETMYIHDLLVYLLGIPFIMMIVAQVVSAQYKNILSYVFGALAGGGIFLIFYLLFKLIMKKEGMGIADVILMAFIGGCIGLRAVLFSMLVASLLGCIIMIPAQLINKKGRDTEYPFAPFLTLGAVVALFTTEPILNWYLNLFRF